jgi:hypothetical protein
MERETGIEPATTGLGSRCSTIELLPLVCAQNNITAPRPSPLGINVFGKEGRSAPKGVLARKVDSEVFRAGQEARRKGLQAREANGSNDAHTNANESGFVFRSCSYANVGSFLGAKPDADDANTQTDMRTRPLEQAVELFRNGVVAIQKNRPQ